MIYNKKNIMDEKLSGLGNVYFPKGCEYCKADVSFINSKDIYGVDKNEYIYYCNQCGARVLSHNKDVDLNVMYSPMGRLADYGLHTMHHKLRRLFHPLWRHGLINDIYTPFLVTYRGDPCIVVSKRGDKEYVLCDFIGNEFTPKEAFTSSDNRTKAYFWLNKYLGLNYDTGIGFYSIEETEKAIEYINSKYFEYNIDYKSYLGDNN